MSLRWGYVDFEISLIRPLPDVSHLSAVPFPSSFCNFSKCNDDSFFALFSKMPSSEMLNDMLIC